MPIVRMCVIGLKPVKRLAVRCETLRFHGLSRHGRADPASAAITIPVPGQGRLEPNAACLLCR